MMIDNKIKEKLLNKIEKEMKEEIIQKNIRKANEIDNKYYNMKIDIEKFIKISEKLKSRDISKDLQGFEKEKEVFLIHNGNPYITYIIAIEAICNNTNIKICVNEVMLGTNIIIIRIINNILEDLNIKTSIEIERMFDKKKIEEKPNQKIIILGNRYQYSMISKYNFQNVQYIPKQSISIYVENDNEQLKELEQKILRYCDENFIDIEVYEADNVDDALKQIEADNEGETVMILTKEKVNLEKIHKAEEKKGIKIEVNKNILKNIEEYL